MASSITVYILKTVLARIERGEQIHGFTVYPEDIKYVQNHYGAFGRATLTVERKKDLTGHQFQPKEERG